MIDCYKCLHHDVCYMTCKYVGCQCYKDKDMWVELPTKKMAERVMREADGYMKAACWAVCPMCNERSCVGRFNCSEVKAWIDKQGRGND